GLLADFTMLNQFIYTASVIPERAVLFTFNGEPIEAFGSEGLSLVDPVDRATFLDHLNLIIITTRPYEVDGVITIEGKANLFEATVSYRTMGPDGPGKSGYTTATCGTGCWGDFEVTIEAADLPADGWIEVFGESAKDGSHENVVVIPGSMIWQVEGGFAERPALGD